ncbi:transmembrane protein 114 [Denticeps clupeoides]|uniref:Transmembrane protein 114 n=1 Tax=Denticeps clupeoides TaxID=299321 RepID=A0AAY4CYJ4_9TELE|nr:transmembrane protein 114 [Denticeps clupeoides]
MLPPCDRQPRSCSVRGKARGVWAEEEPTDAPHQPGTLCSLSLWWACALGGLRMSLKALSIFSAAVGVFSFVCLIVAIGTDFWYIIHVSERKHNSSVSLSSHTGLWRTCNFQNKCSSLINPFGNGNFTYSERQILNMHGAFVVLLPFSVIVMVVGGMLGIVSVLARAYLLLMVTGCLLLFGALLSLTGVCIYKAYSAAAYQEALQAAGRKALDDIDIHFGWSLALACVSLVSEFFAAIAFLASACRVRQLKRMDQGIEIK